MENWAQLRFAGAKKEIPDINSKTRKKTVQDLKFASFYQYYLKFPGVIGVQTQNKKREY